MPLLVKVDESPLDIVVIVSVDTIWAAEDLPANHIIGIKLGENFGVS